VKQDWLIKKVLVHLGVKVPIEEVDDTETTVVIVTDADPVLVTDIAMTDMIDVAPHADRRLVGLRDPALVVVPIAVVKLCNFTVEIDGSH
jgi:hypothetical protein